MKFHKRELLLNMGSAKDKHGVRERFAKKTFLFAKNGRSRTKAIGSTVLYFDKFRNIICMHVGPASCYKAFGCNLGTHERTDVLMAATR